MGRQSKRKASRQAKNSFYTLESPECKALIKKCKTLSKEEAAKEIFIFGFENPYTIGTVDIMEIFKEIGCSFSVCRHPSKGEGYFRSSSMALLMHAVQRNKEEFLFILKHSDTIKDEYPSIELTKSFCSAYLPDTFQWINKTMPTPKTQTSRIKIDLSKATGNLSFYKFEGVVYNLDSEKEHGINIANQSSRYKEFKNIIDAAVEDLSSSSYTDGKWVFNTEHGKWFNAPISAVELIGISQFNPNAERYINLDTPFNVVESFTVSVTA